MYHVTTSAGPTEDVDTPTAAVELLRAQLREHLHEGPVSWQISDDVLEGFHAGRMQACPGDRNYDAEVDEHVQEVRVNLIVEQHDTAEAAGCDSSRPGRGGAIAAAPASGSAAGVGWW